MKNTIAVLPARYYHAIFDNNLQIVGVEDRLPMLIGDGVDFMNFYSYVKENQLI